MPRNMSFAATTQQIRDRTKDVTRRKGWRFLKPGDRFWACVKCQGLKKGERIEHIVLLECVSNRREPLCAIKPDDVVREGFPGKSPAEFVLMFMRLNNCGPRDPINRIEFKYLEDLS